MSNKPNAWNQLSEALESLKNSAKILKDASQKMRRANTQMQENQKILDKINKDMGPRIQEVDMDLYRDKTLN